MKVAKNKNKKAEQHESQSTAGDMSVDELVNLLRDNISSEEIPPKEDSADNKKQLHREKDPESDIAAMLKKFMPEDSEEAEDTAEDFELDEVSQYDTTPEIDADFELEGEGGDYEVEFSPVDIINEFEIDDAPSNEMFEEPVESEAADFEEFVPEELTASSEEIELENESALKKPKKKKKGGLFGFGRKKNISLADGYAMMLENELEGEDIPVFGEASEIAAEEAELPGGTQSEAAFDSLTDSEMPELDSVISNSSSKEQPENEESVTSEMFVFGEEKKENEREEEYFEAGKKPLAFENEDEAPFVPDSSAFDGVKPSDISEFAEDENEASDEANLSDSALDDKDINLMLALGYEDELEKAIGKENVDVISDQLSAEIVDFIDVDNAYAFDGFELGSPDSFKAVGNKYKQEHSLMKFRLLGTGIFTAVLFIFELLSMFGVTLGGALNINHYPVVGIMLSLQVLVLAASLSWKQIMSGLYDLVTFNPSPASIPSAALLMTVIYDVIMALVSPHSGLWLYNFPAALSVLLLVLSDYFNLSREIRTFNTIATRRPKYALSTVNQGDKSAEEEMMEIFSDDAQSHFDEKVLEVRRVGFIDNYFRRSNIRSPKDRKIGLLIFPFIALGIALGVVSYVTSRSGVAAFNISILTVLFGMPLSSLFTLSFPLYSASEVAFKRDAAIIGEESVEEYADAGSVSFADKEVFPVEATITKGIKLYDNNAIYNVLYHLTSVYSKLGGPLKERLEQATTELGHSENVEIISSASKGVSAVVDGKVNVLMGQYRYIAENGIAIGYDPDDDKMLSEGATALYLVLDGVLSAKLYVSYEMDPEFMNVISILAEENTETVIRTADPGIDNDLLMTKLPVSQLPVKIIKCKGEENKDVPNAEGGIVARSSITSLASTITLCNKIRRTRKAVKKFGIMSMVIGIIIMLFLALFSSKPGVASVYVALYQIFWTLPLVLFTKLYIK